MPESILLHEASVGRLRKKIGARRRRVESYGGAEPIEGESDPPEEFRVFFPLMQEALIAEQEKFDLVLKSKDSSGFTGREYVNRPVAKNIDPERVHYLPGDVYADGGAGAQESFGTYLIGEQSIHLAEKRPGLEASGLSPERKRSVRLRSLQHESLHMVSYEADYLGKKGAPVLYRQGYMVFNTQHRIERFRGLNEAVVEQTNALVFRSLIPKLVKAFPGSDEKDWKYGQPIYEAARTVLSDIIRNTSKHTGESITSIWEKYEKGLFTGSMMHLSDVDRVYGPGSLRLLAAMGTYEGVGVSTKPFKMNSGDWRDVVDQCFLEYFEEPGLSWEKRRRIAKDVLSEKEFERFEKLNLPRAK